MLNAIIILSTEPVYNVTWQFFSQLYFVKIFEIFVTA